MQGDNTVQDVAILNSYLLPGVKDVGQTNLSVNFGRVYLTAKVTDCVPHTPHDTAVACARMWACLALALL